MHDPVLSWAAPDPVWQGCQLGQLLPQRIKRLDLFGFASVLNVNARHAGFDVVLAFVNHVMGEANRIVIKAGTNQAQEARFLAGALCSLAGQKRRELLGLPEPDPDVDYDLDCHMDGTERLPGEPRREKGKSYAEGLDLSALLNP